MATITFTVSEEKAVYRRVGDGFTGEIYQAPALPIPPLVIEAMGLMPCSFSAEGLATEYMLCYPLMDERIVQEAKAEEKSTEEKPAPVVYAKDGTDVQEGFEWKLDVRPEAVRQCGCKLRGEGKETYIEQPEPATTKAAYHEGEHRRATMIVYRAEAQKRRVT